MSTKCFRVLILRPQEHITEFKEKLLNIDVSPISIPSIKLIPNSTEIENALQEISKYDIAIFTSVNGVKFTLSRVQDLSIFKNIEICAIGPKTKKAIEEFNLKVSFMPDEYTSDKIVNALPNINNKKIILFRSNIANKELPTKLKEKGAIVKDIPSYNTLILDITNELKKAFQETIDLVIFTSGSTVISFAQAVRNLPEIPKTKFLSIGPQTTKTAISLGINVNYTAKEYTINGIIKTIKEILNESKTIKKK